jgi:hypothetical protein
VNGFGGREIQARVHLRFLNLNSKSLLDFL